MPGNPVEIDTSAVDRLSARLNSIGSDMKTNAARKILKNIGSLIKKNVERRYVDRSPNNVGGRWEPILLSSEMRRGNKRIPKAVEKQLEAARKAGRTTRKTGAPTSGAMPLVTTNAKPQAVITYSGDEMRIGPNESRLVKLGEHAGMPIDAFASPPEISGFARTTGTQPNRAAYFLSPQDETAAWKIAEDIVNEDIEKALDK